MAKERMPWEIIRDLAIKYDKLSDAKLLAKLRSIPPLPDESDEAAWNQQFWDDVAYDFLALSQVVCTRQLRVAIQLILDRLCFGDPGEIMRGMCHVLEGIVQPNYFDLTPYCVAALKSERAGTRLWAAHQLARLRDPVALPALETAASDPVPWVREWVEMALETTREEASKGGKPKKKRK